MNNSHYHFKGKSIDGVWVYGIPYINNEKYYIIPNNQDISLNQLVSIEVIGTTISQYVFQDKNGLNVYEGDVIKQYVTRLSSNPWWTISSKNDGTNINYFLYKLVIRGVNKHGLTTFKLVNTQITNIQKTKLCEPLGNEKIHRVIDDLNYKQQNLELVGNIWDNHEYTPFSFENSLDK